MVDFYTKLLELRRAEGASRGLAKIPPDFYVQARAYLAEVRRVFETELRENPSGKKGEVARQTHARAIQLARDLAEARTTKIISGAFQSAVGGARDLANALPEERVLFDRLVETMKEFRLSATPYLEGAAGAPASAPPAAPAAGGLTSAAHPASGAGVPAARATGGRTALPVLIHVLKGSPPVEMGGETVELRAEDVLTVSSDLARILIEGKVAERIEPRDAELTS